eukprot:CAMPEP_0178995818 /NCGR_PEP_ID=MMETSP0795-20121207/8020_1 /TAXON_ID=88552 /ORGANISM="Amoebophrya sp., Strain Ameob2" /LENGTH=85 /DNA_ID=CAMNT_0020688131 /DNA_START=1001 /DNA_END=1259 /DNA_ORIENTATION=-
MSLQSSSDVFPSTGAEEDEYGEVEEDEDDTQAMLPLGGPDDPARPAAAEVQHLRLQAYAPRSGFAGSFAPDFFFPVGLVMLAMAG